MNSADASLRSAALSQRRVLQRLYLTLMFRGQRTGSNRKRLLNPVRSFVLTALLFAALGLIALGMGRMSFASFAGSLHALTFLVISMGLATSSGSLLFSTEEADVLLHRPVQPRALLTAKVQVIVLTSLVTALALNIGGFIHGVTRRDGSWLFIPAHFISLTLEVIFCASFVVLAYNLCLRWFGRERLDNLMTSVQVIVAVAAMVGGQVVPRMIGKMDFEALSAASSWLVLLPPAWFGALDTILTGRAASPGLLGFAACGIVATLATAWLGVSRLAATYEQGLVMLNETGPSAVKTGANRGRLVTGLLQLPFVQTWVRDPVERIAFRLAVAELTRARGVKLRVYPMLAQLLVYPLVIFFGGGGRGSTSMDTMAVAFAGAFVSMLPLTVLDRLRLAEDWKAADLFLQAPLSRPAALFHGTRKAVILTLCLPGLLLVLGLGMAWLRGRAEMLLLIVPGLLVIPVFSLLPALGGTYLPFSEQPEVEGSNSSRWLLSLLFMIGSFTIAGLATWAWSTGWFHWLLLAEAFFAFGLGALLGRLIDNR